MNPNPERTERRFHLLGWLLFLVCAIFFIMQSLESGTILGLVGSALFLAGCVVFLVPLVLGEGTKAG